MTPEEAMQDPSSEQPEVPHSPLPWHIANGVEIRTDERPYLGLLYSTVATCCGVSLAEAQANARFIARACNLHEELLAALYLCEEVIGNNSCSDGHTPNGFVVALEQARDAIAKAKT